MKYQKDRLELPRLGLGCSRMSSSLSSSNDRSESIATIQAALDTGIRFINTADFYGSGHNEMLIGEALKGFKRDKVFISLKFGALVAPNGMHYGIDVRPKSVKNYCAYSLQRLRLDYIDLYQPGRIDPDIPVEETIGAISELVHAGYVKHIGITQVNAETLQRAHTAYPISLVEQEYSLFNRNIEKELLPTARKLGIGIVAFGVLSQGLLSGSWTKDRPKEKLNYSPRFADENFDKNLLLVEALREIAVEKNITLSQLAYAWILSKGEDIIPLVGARRVTQLQETITSLDVTLSESDIKRIENVVPHNAVAGGFFPGHQ